MGFWNKLGKIALQAAPYVAAPFTGGASLMATGATQKLGQKWAESDAKKAIAKGLAPSKFDSILGKVSAGVGLASAFTGGFGGALAGKAGNTVGTGLGSGVKLGSIASKAGTGASSVGKLSGFSGQLANALSGKGVAGQVASATGLTGGSDWKGQLGGLIQQAANRNPGGADTPSSSQNAPPVGSNSNQAMPRPSGLAAALNRGKDLAILNQPYRQGYDTVIQGDEEGQTITQRMPQIYPNYGPPASDSGPAPASVLNPPAATPIANRFNDELTPRRRVPRQQPVEEEY
jgi:hypothetical protein